MKSLSFILLFQLFQISAKAEIISLPDYCFEKKISPCLVRVLNAETLIDKKNKLVFSMHENTIVKWLGFDENFSIDLLQGRMRVSAANQELFNVVLNDVKFSSSQIFAHRKEQILEVFNTKNFVLSQYEINEVQKKESVVAKSDFPTKAEMVEFVSAFYENKKELVSFLKDIEKPWQKEFQIQNDLQTKVLQRSVASVENAEKEKKLKQQRDIEELKKVRDLFFYRTFYR